MNRVPLNDLIRIKLTEAQARGLARPVLLLFGQDTPQARALFTDLFHREMRRLTIPLEEGQEVGRLEVVAAAEAVALLGRHAGAGGAAAAEHVADGALHAEWFLVALRREGIFLTAFARGEPLLSAELDYERVGRCHQPLGRLAEDPGPGMAKFSFPSGEYTVFGRTGHDVLGAATLVSLVSARPGTARLPHPETGEYFPVRVTEEKVRGLLLDAYADRPHQVAEAITALRKVAPAKAAWLQRLMRNSPGLQGLHRAVKEELTGEAG
jgi:hypothetical protein